jgi:hypothetical protein
MNDEQLENQLKQIQDQLSLLTNEMIARKRQREEMQELRDDLSIIAKDIFRSTAIELDDVAPFIKTGDLLHLLKGTLRNIPKITAAIGQFESAIDFIDDVKPLSSEVFTNILEKLQVWEQKGYFELTKGIMEVLDEVLTKISPDDLKHMADNIILPLVELSKTTGDMNFLQALNSTVAEFPKLKPTQFDNYNPWLTFKDARTVEMRRALGRTIWFLSTLANETNKVKENN